MNENPFYGLGGASNAPLPSHSSTFSSLSSHSLEPVPELPMKKKEKDNISYNNYYTDE